jgi:hypothetical protein
VMVEERSRLEGKAELPEEGVARRRTRGQQGTQAAGVAFRRIQEQQENQAAAGALRLASPGPTVEVQVQESCAL